MAQSSCCTKKSRLPKKYHGFHDQSKTTNAITPLSRFIQLFHFIQDKKGSKAAKSHETDENGNKYNETTKIQSNQSKSSEDEDITDDEIKIDDDDDDFMP